MHTYRCRHTGKITDIRIHRPTETRQADTEPQRQTDRFTDRRRQSDREIQRRTERQTEGSGVSYFGVTADGVFPVTVAFLNTVRPPRPLRTGQIARGAEQTRMTIAEAEDPVAVTSRTLLRAFHVTPRSVET